jgi:hypothetical protein
MEAPSPDTAVLSVPTDVEAPDATPNVEVIWD